MWPDFCDAIQMPELKSDPRYATNDLRCENFESFTRLMQDVFKDKTSSWLMERFSEYRIPATTIVDPVDAMKHPQILARDMIIDIDDPNVGHFRAFGIPVKFSGTPGYVKKPSPLLGENSCDVLKEAGYTQEEIDGLIAGGIIGTADAV